jgi:hypothetical protein
MNYSIRSREVPGIKLMLAVVLEFLILVFFFTMLVYVEYWSGTPGKEYLLLGGLSFMPLIGFGIVGCISALQRKRYGWALVGAILAVCTIVGIPALGLIILSRKDFRPQNADNTQYGVSRNSKNIDTSLLLAIFVALFTWLYTYQKDAWKFWTSLGLIISITILGVFGIGVPIYSIGTASMVIWALSIVDVAVKNEQWYKYYR